MESLDLNGSDGLDALSVGFRSRYITYEELTRQVRAWAEAFPSVVRLQSLCETPQKRALWLLTIGRDPDRPRPAVWVDGNMHASELAGTAVALTIAEEIIRAHLAPDSHIVDLPRHIADLVRSDLLFYVLPRMCPDGAELVLSTGAFVRSNPREHRPDMSAPLWRPGDIDGDGQARVMRRLDPAGDFVLHPTEPHLMLPRRVEDPGPYYTLHPEGLIEGWDGLTIPSSGFVSDAETDMNRNFPYDWAPEHIQKGAGAFPVSEPESRAVTEFVSARPHIFAWINYHCFGGVYIRPLGNGPDRAMNSSDFALYRQIGEWAEQIAGYPMVSGFEEFTYEPDKPLRGELSSFAYQMRGAVSMVCELWDFWRAAGLSVLRPFVWNYQRRTREEITAMARWDREHNKGRIIGAWKPFEHPQIGPVEIGGYDPRFGIWNPPPERLPEVCSNQARVVARIAALAPRIRLGGVEMMSLGGGLSRIRAVVENIGYLPTNVLASAKALAWNEPVRARVTAGEGLELVTPEEQAVGHLGGWGGYEKSATPVFARTSGEPVRRRVEWVVRGSGTAVIRAGCSRTGHVELAIDVG
ncbi:MAG: peptidase M14 [Polyangiaceae bacterium]|nr:peptidase M14 [Polyangiaceae bacterium]